MTDMDLYWIIQHDEERKRREQAENDVLDLIDEDTAKSVPELAEETGLSERDVQRALEGLMDRGRITSTPDWEYRESRRAK